MARTFVVPRAMRFGLLLIFLKGAMWAYPIRGSFLSTLEPHSCGDRPQGNEVRLLWSPQKVASFPILDANCVALFSSQLRSRQSDGELGLARAQQRASCHETVFDEVLSPSSGKPKFCGTICDHGRPLRGCTY